MVEGWKLGRGGDGSDGDRGRSGSGGEGRGGVVEVINEEWV